MNENMILPSFDVFKEKYNKHEDSVFEQFCYLLFCVEFNQYEKIFRYKNIDNIETEPILFNDKYIWWQSKFFEVKLEENKNNFINMIDTVKKKYPKLDVLIIYTNKEWEQDKNGEKCFVLNEIEQRAEEENIKIEWKTKKFFDSSFVMIDNIKISKYFLFYNNGYGQDKLDLYLNEMKENYDKLISDFLVNNTIFEKLNYTTNSFVEKYFHIDISKEEISEFDLNINFLKDVFIGNSSFKNFDYEGFLKVLEKEHNQKCVFEFVKKRWDAINLYYNNELDLCLKKMINLFSEYKDNVNIPVWLRNDLLIDIRDLEITICNENNTLFYETEEFKKLEHNLSKPLYYPYIDRLEINLRAKIIKQTIDENVNYMRLNIYTISGIFREIVKIFSVACFFGSLTYMKKIIENLDDFYLSLLSIHNDKYIYSELIKIKIYELDYTSIKKYKIIFSEPSDYIDEKYVINLYNMSDNYPLNAYKNKMKIIIFLLYSDYLLEKEFKKRKKELILLINKWINDSNADVSIGYIIIEILKKCNKRFDSNELVLIIIKFLESDKEKFYDDALVLSLRCVIYNDVTDKNKKILMNTFFKLVKNEKKSYIFLNEAITHLAKENLELREEIDKFLEIHNQSYFERKFFFDNSSKNLDERLNYIKEQLKYLEKKIKFQEGSDPQIYFNLIIRVLMDGDEIKIPDKIVLELENYIEIVLKNKNSKKYDKIFAITLLQYLIVKKCTLKKDKWKKVIKNNFSTILIVENNLFIPPDNRLSQSLNLLLFILGGYQSIELIDIISNCEVSNDIQVDKYGFICSMVEWLEIEEVNNINDDIIKILRQYALNNIKSNVVFIKERAWEILFLISKKEDLKLTIMKAKLSLKNEIYRVKILILKNIIKLKDVEDIKDEIYEVKKICLSDNHYMVRSVANEIDF